MNSEILLFYCGYIHKANTVTDLYEVLVYVLRYFSVVSYSIFITKFNDK